MCNLHRNAAQRKTCFLRLVDVRFRDNMAADIRSMIGADSSQNVYVGKVDDYDNCTAVKIYFTGKWHCACLILSLTDSLYFALLFQ